MIVFHIFKMILSRYAVMLLISLWIPSYIHMF